MSYKSSETIHEQELRTAVAEKGDRNFNDLTCSEMRTHVNSNWVNNLSKIDWGKHNARPNEIIVRDILSNIFASSPGYSVYTTDDEDCPEIDTSNNSPGFDLVIKHPDGKLTTIQCKLRQVDGIGPFTRQIHFETTRRHSKKNENKNHTGHVCYSADEFDYVLVTLVHVPKNDLENRNDINHWKFSLIPIRKLVDEKKGCCKSAISAKLLDEYKIFN
jgi:hypothetical protein